MPIFVNGSGVRVFYAHVPKTGGTYVEDFFRKNGFSVKLWNGKPVESGLLITPQHFHRSLFEEFVNFDMMRWSFITVRHPLDRLISEYRSTYASHKLEFADYLATAHEKLQVQRNWRDNHLRPQVEFMHPALEVMKNEDRFDAKWAKVVAKKAGFELQVKTVNRRRHTKVTIPLSFDASHLDQAQEFCMTHYAEDFTAFDYKMDAAEVFHKSEKSAEPTS